jgi:ABC-type sugar transport system ATPase subunit
LGIAGLLGSGADLKVRGLFGAGPEPVAVQLADGATALLKQPSNAIAHGIGLVPGTRALGLVLNQSVRDNILLPNLAQLGSVFRIDRARADALVNEMIDLMDIRPKRPDIRAGALSGGNQQKVILAKWLARRVSVLLLDEPTHGIDIAAKMHVHALIRRFTQNGGGVLVSSSDLGELARLCDSVLAMRERHIVGRVERADGMNEARLRAALERTR